MKVSKDMLDESLQPHFAANNILSFICSRTWTIKLIQMLISPTKGKDIEGIHGEVHFIPSNNGGPPIRVRVFKPLNNTEKLPAMLYNHGGGYMIGNPEIALSSIKQFIDTRPCVVVAPDYRKALTAPYPAAFDDCYDTLLWAKDNAKMLGIFEDNFIVAGHSAGGGLTAAVTLKARDTKDVDIAFQMPIYPMIDDQQLNESARDMDIPGWNTRTNAFAWNLYLKDLIDNKQQIPTYAAPARNTDYTDFPPTITYVGEYEPFKDETELYVEALKNAGVPVAYKFYKGCFHGFDLAASKASVSKDALAFCDQSYAEFYDAYVTPANET